MILSAAFVGASPRRFKSVPNSSRLQDWVFDDASGQEIILLGGTAGLLTNLLIIERMNLRGAERRTGFEPRMRTRNVVQEQGSDRRCTDLLCKGRVGSREVRRAEEAVGR